jgi:hypothetical protein
MQLSESTVATLELIADPDNISKFGNTINGNDLRDGLLGAFAKYETPLGMINKLHRLSDEEIELTPGSRKIKGWKLNFIIDDSGSMGFDTDVKISEGTQYIKDWYLRNEAAVAEWHKIYKIPRTDHMSR